MHETENDLGGLQVLLDQSMASAGPHLLEVVTPERWLGATELCTRLTGLRLLALATVTADGRPLVGPVDGIFYRGSSTSARRRTPCGSAIYDCSPR